MTSKQTNAALLDELRRAVKSGKGVYWHRRICKQAADEIERLERELAIEHQTRQRLENVHQAAMDMWRAEEPSTDAEMALAAAHTEINRLKREQADGTTHAEGCYRWGPRHYDCAAREIERLERELIEARCSDCPPAGYPTDTTRCAECDRREP